MKRRIVKRKPKRQASEFILGVIAGALGVAASVVMYMLIMRLI